MRSLLWDAHGFEHIQKLKFVYRFSGRTFNNELESVAAHTWCMHIVADYLLSLLEASEHPVVLNRLRVYELITYHDLLEAETGDVDLDPSMSSSQKTKKQREENMLPIFVKKLPESLQERYVTLLQEYEERDTLESKFVKIVDIVECELQCHLHKELFENWTREYFISKCEEHFRNFPELMPIYQEILAFYDANNYLH